MEESYTQFFTSSLPIGSITRAKSLNTTIDIMKHQVHHQSNNYNSRQPLIEMNTTPSSMLAPPIKHTAPTAATTTIPRVTITTSPILEQDENKLPTLTTPPQTITRSVSNSITRKHDHASSIITEEVEEDNQEDEDDEANNTFGKIAQSKKLKKAKKSKSNTGSLLSPAFSSPPPTKAEKSNSLPARPEAPKFVQTSNMPKIKSGTRKEKSQADIDRLNAQVPPPELMPRVIDTSTDFTKKPAYSYAMLIGMSILRGPNRRLTLSQIYDWISDTFKYYKRGDIGWQNSVRHNLSLNKAFVKSARSKDRKGHFWHIAKGCEYQFYLGKGAAPVDPSVQAHFQQQQQQQQLILQQQQVLDQQAQASSSFHDDTSDEDNNQHSYDDDEEAQYNDDDNNEYADEGDETVRIVQQQQTPRSKIIPGHYDDNGREHLVIPHNNYSSSQLQLHLANVHNNKRHVMGYEDTDDILQPPTKKPHHHFLSSTGAGHLNIDTIPNLQPPSPNWAASASGDRVIFGLLKTPPKMSSNSTASHQTSQTSIFDSPLQLQKAAKHDQHQPQQSQNPASRYQQFTSSFSCISTFELSPLKGTETGPLLEPLTPAQNLSRDTEANIGHASNYNNNNNNSINNSSSHNKVKVSLNSGASNNLQSLQTPSILKTPFTKNNLIMRTPGSSVMKKIWNSPSYLDDFYTSPVVHKGIPFEKEEIVVSSARAFGSPSKNKAQKK